MQGNPLVCSRDTMLVLDATSAEARDLHFVDGDIRRTWTHGGRATAVHVFTKQCPDSLVGSWGTYEPVFFRFRPGVLVEDIRRPGYTETLDTTHQVGALTYKAVRPKKSPLEVKQSWYVAGKWCVVGTVEMRNLTDTAEDAAALAVGLNLRSPVNLNRGQLDWFADFHSNGKAGVPMVPRLSDAEYQKLTEITKYHIEYRPQDRCFVARTGCDVRAPQPAEYFACLMLDSPVSRHVLADGGDVHQAGAVRRRQEPSAAVGDAVGGDRAPLGEFSLGRRRIPRGQVRHRLRQDGRRSRGPRPPGARRLRRGFRPGSRRRVDSAAASGHDRQRGPQRAPPLRRHHAGRQLGAGRPGAGRPGRLGPARARGSLRLQELLRPGRHGRADPGHAGLRSGLVQEGPAVRRRSADRAAAQVRHLAAAVRQHAVLAVRGLQGLDGHGRRRVPEADLPGPGQDAAVAARDAHRTGRPAPHVDDAVRHVHHRRGRRPAGDRSAPRPWPATPCKRWSAWRGT